MTKQLEPLFIHFPNGDVWSISIAYAAKFWAAGLAAEKHGGRGGPAYRQTIRDLIEYESVLGHMKEIADYLIDNTSWNDVKEHAERYQVDIHDGLYELAWSPKPSKDPEEIDPAPTVIVLDDQEMADYMIRFDEWKEEYAEPPEMGYEEKEFVGTSPGEFRRVEKVEGEFVKQEWVDIAGDVVLAEGDLWFDPNTSILMRWDGEEWLEYIPEEA